MYTRDENDQIVIVCPGKVTITIPDGHKPVWKEMRFSDIAVGEMFSVNNESVNFYIKDDALLAYPIKYEERANIPNMALRQFAFDQMVWAFDTVPEIRAISMRELFDMPKREKLASIENEEVGFRDHNYWIELDRIKSKADLLGWIHHLSQKRWITTIHICDFIEVVCSQKSWEIYKE